MVDISTGLFDQKDDLIAKGVPNGDVSAIVNACRRSDHERLAQLRQKALTASQELYGVGAITEQALDTYIDEISVFAADLMYVRKMARGLDLNLDAINLLTQAIRDNPADKGSGLLNDVVGYARSYGIPVGSMHLVASRQTPESGSVLPDVKKTESVTRGLWQYRDVLVEVCVGVALSVAALWLLV